MTKLTSFAVLLCATALVSCDKNAVQDITGPVAESRIKFYNFAVGGPGVYFYANDVKHGGATSIGYTVDSKTGRTAGGTESTTGIAYGGAAPSNGGAYAAVAAGSYTLAAKIAATTDYGLAIATATQTVASGKAYSFFVSGIYDGTTKKAEAFVVEDNYPATIDWTQAYVRFVNAVSNSNPMSLVATQTTTLAETPLGAVTAYKGAGAFMPIPAGVYNLGAREAGATTNKMSRSSVSFNAGRVYTIAARGNILTTSTQSLDFTANR